MKRWSSVLTVVLALALVTSSTAIAGEGPSGVGAERVLYGVCDRVHPTVANIWDNPYKQSRIVGQCRSGDHFRTNNDAPDGRNVKCDQPGTSSNYWYYIRDLRTNVTGWVSFCFIGGLH